MRLWDYLLCRKKLHVHGILIHDFDIFSLYSAVAHQLELSGEKPLPIQLLRKNTANYLLKHKEEFIPYFEEDIAESPEKFEKYCKEIEGTAAWGGQIEVRIWFFKYIL